MRHSFILYFFISTVFLYFFSATIVVSSTKTDSATSSIYLLENDIDKVQSLNKRSKLILDSHTEVAIKLASAALNIAKWNGYKNEIIDSYNIIAACYFKSKNYAKALENYFWAIRYAEKTSDSYLIARGYRNLAFVYKSLNMPKESIQFSELSLKFLEKKNNDDLRTDCYYYLASSYGLQRKYEEETGYLLKAIDLRIKNKQWKEAGMEYNSLGAANFNLKKFDDAFKYFSLYLNISIQSKDSLGIAIAYNNLAETLENKGEYQKAVDFYNKALVLKQSNISYSYIGLVRTYCKMNNTSKADYYFNAAYNSKSDLNELAESCKILTERLKRNNDYSKAFYFNDIFLALNDSIMALSRKEVELFKPQYDVEGIQERIAQAEINELLKENYSLQSKQNRLLIIIVVLAIITSIFSVYMIRKRMLAKANKLKFVEKNVLEMGKYLKDMREIISQR